MINEIFYSLQGESTWAGLPCAFVRLTGCHLRCSYCDTAYAFHEGSRSEMDELIDRINTISNNCNLVEITGGEPLLQPGVHELIRRLADAGKTVLIETSGACDISPCDSRVIRIVDFKTPGSGQEKRNDWNNINHLTKQDEVKFVLCDHHDYQWACARIAEHNIVAKVKAVLLSPAFAMPASKEIAGTPGLAPLDLSQWILADHLPVRMQLPIHKAIWGPKTRGV
jgi:7-carboxy-7-deazaguanine synthase